MKRIINQCVYGLSVGVLGWAFSACEPKLEVPAPSKGSADFTKYVAVGNSLTAGFADNGLYRAGQLNSYPSIVAGQFKSAGGGEFNQPLFSEAQANGSGYVALAGLSGGVLTIVPVTTNLAVTVLGADNKTRLLAPYEGPINNLGIPGIRLADIKTAGYGLNNPQGFNPFYERLLPANAKTKTYLQFVAESKPTFFSNWLGNNDVLGYASSGGANTAPSNTLTPTNTFEALYKEILDSLTKNGAKGVCITIPNVTSAPFFTTVGPTLRGLLAQNNVPGLVCQTGNAGTIIQVPTANIGSQVLIPLTASLYVSLIGRPTGKYWRDLATAQGVPVANIIDTYSLDTTKAFAGDPKNPWPSALMLDETELTNIANATNAFNTIITTEANTRGLALVNINALLDRVRQGIVVQGATVSAAFLSGGAFSLDGVHLTPRGYALVANEIITAINARYGARVPLVNASAYPGVKFP